MNSKSAEIKPDVLGMEMPAAASILDRAGISYNEVLLQPFGREADRVSQAPLRVIRQTENQDGSFTLDVCRVPDIDL